MDPALKQPWVSIEKTHRLGWVGSELDNEVRKENLAAGSQSTDLDVVGSTYT